MKTYHFTWFMCILFYFQWRVYSTLTMICHTFSFQDIYVKAEGVVPYWRWSWPWPCSKMQLQFGTCYWESYQQKYWWVPIHMKFYTICYKLKQMCNMGASILTMKTTLPRRSGVQTFCYLFLFSCEMFYENTIL